MNTQTSAHLFIDNTDYTSILDNIGSNKTVDTPLIVHSFSFKQSGELLATLQYNPQDSEMADKIQAIANNYPDKISIQGNYITIQDTVSTTGFEARSMRSDGINYMIDGTFGEDDQPTQRAFGISINRDNSDIPSNNIDRSDEL